MEDAASAKVLVIEDDRAVQNLAGSLLSSRGYEVRCASNGAVGLEQAITFRPEVILFDFWMPVADGRALVQGLREVVKTRVGLACMSATPEVEDWCARIGVSAFVRKPFTATELCKAVDRALEDVRASVPSLRVVAEVAPTSRPRADRTVLLVGRGARPPEVRASLRAQTSPMQVAGVDSASDALRVLASIAIDAVAVCGDSPDEDPDVEELVAEGIARKLPVLVADGVRAAGDDSGALDAPRSIAERLRALAVR